MPETCPVPPHPGSLVSGALFCKLSLSIISLLLTPLLFPKKSESFENKMSACLQISPCMRPHTSLFLNLKNFETRPFSAESRWWEGSQEMTRIKVWIPLYAWQTPSPDARLNTQGCGGIRNANRMLVCWSRQIEMDLASLALLLLRLTAEIFGTVWLLSCADNLNGFLELSYWMSFRDSFQES